MAKIKSSLKAEITKKPNAKIKVLITVQEGIDPEKLNIKNKSVLMPGIISASLNKKEISSLSKSKNILSIEMDSEMEAL